MTDIEKLKKLSTDLNNPGPDKLYIAARKRGLKVTKKEVKTLLSRLGERQIFQSIQPSRGKAASEDIDARFQMDLIDLHNDAAFDKLGANKFILILVNVFTREVYAEALAKKEPSAVKPALEKILDELDAAPTIISSDNGQEFLGPVSTMLKARNITQKFKEVGDVNALSVVDRAIQNIKKRIAQILSRDGNTKTWRDALADAVKNYNETYHSTVHAAPNEVAVNEDVIFMNLVDNSEKLVHNQQIFEKRKTRLEQAGAFRAPLPGSTKKFKRGFQATYGGVTNVKNIEGSQVIGENGVVIDIKRVLPVAEGSSTAVGRFGENRALETRKRDQTENIMRALYDFLEDKDNVSLTAAAKHLRQRISEYDSVLKRASVQLVDIIRLYPEFLKLTGGGKLSKDFYYVARVA